MNALLPDVIAAEPVERKFLKGLKAGQFKAHDYDGQLAEALAADVVTQAEHDLLKRVHTAVFEFISVDDFDPAELRAAVSRADERRKQLADAA
jgi:acyl-CoA dehydrogenase